MKTMCEILFNMAEIDIKDAKKTAKEMVLREADDSKCIKTSKGYTIKCSCGWLGDGKTEDSAWEDAVLNVLML
jgi:hypothetical protein